MMPGERFASWIRKALSCDYVFLDPPYRLHEAYDEALGFLGQSRILKASSIVIAEHDKRHDPGESFEPLSVIAPLRRATVYSASTG